MKVRRSDLHHAVAQDEPVRFRAVDSQTGMCEVYGTKGMANLAIGSEVPRKSPVEEASKPLQALNNSRRASFPPFVSQGEAKRFNMAERQGMCHEPRKAMADDHGYFGAKAGHCQPQPDVKSAPNHCALRVLEQHPTKTRREVLYAQLGTTT
jgi:hypothetical protein